MLKQLVELAKAKKQVNIAFTALTAEKFILGIAPANAGTDKIAPFMAKGTVEEIETQLAGLDAFITAALSKKPEVKEPETDKDDGEETDATVQQHDGLTVLQQNSETVEPENRETESTATVPPPAVEPVPAAAPVVNQAAFEF